MFKNIKQIDNKTLYHNYIGKNILFEPKIKGTRFEAIIYSNGDIIFNKKNGKIDYIDRTINKIYEEPISYMYNVWNTIYNYLKENDFHWINLGFRYNRDLKTDEQYIDIQHKLILTDFKYSNYGNVFTGDYDKIGKIAEMISVNSLQPIQQYKFTKKHANIINDYKKGKCDFENFLIKLLGYKSNEFDNDLIVRIHGDNYIIDFNKSVKNYNDNSDSYFLIVKDIVKWIYDNYERFDLDNLKVYNENKDKRYIEIISKIFNYYISENIENIPTDLCNYFYYDDEDLRINFEFVNNIQTKNLLFNNIEIRPVYQIMLGIFRKNKFPNLNTNLIGNDIIQIFDNVKYNLNNLINKEKDKSLENITRQESNNVMTFKDIKNI